ncbi:MAG: A/G-specific adenine glycosylase [Fimbriimonadaceae bacterium]|nr:A/G-specific adenine glycosylase [Fimbriimonadaceae bacterium]
MSSLHAPLLAWYDAVRRDLPWRRNQDPYAIWISEIMLQQTQVATVIPYFERWMARFPDVQTLAAADEQEALAHWQGLGYYRRARLLQEAARVLAAAGKGFPRTAAELLSLPGIGRYTAGAISSIAFNKPEPLVDGNVERVFARLTGFGEPKPSLTRAAWDWAAVHIHAERPGDWNQALMELGATVCRPIEPDCAHCPVQQVCLARREGRVERLPAPSIKPMTIAMVSHVWVPICGKRVGVRQIPAGEWWEGMWEFPRARTDEEMRELIPGAWPETAGSFRHSVTHHRILVYVARVRLEREVEGLRWIDIDEIDSIPMPAAQRRALKRVEMLDALG